MAAQFDIEALEKLKGELLKLSQTLDEIDGLIGTDMRSLNESWTDCQFSDFENALQPHRSTIKAIATAYEHWAKHDLQARIDKGREIAASRFGG